MKCTLTGLPGAGKGTCGLLLAGRLNAPFVSAGDLMRSLAKERGYTLQEFEELAKKDPQIDKLIDQRTRDFGGQHSHFVFDGRIAWHFIPDSKKVLLVCDPEIRFMRIGLRENKDFTRVREETLHRERATRNRYREYYNIAEFDAPEHFDLVIDTSNQKPEVVVSAIIRKLGLMPTPP